MNTQPLRVAKSPGKRRRIGWILRTVLAIAVIAMGGWYALPEVLHQIRDANPAQTLVTTDDVNLRSGPGLDHDVVMVIPVGTEVVAESGIANGYREVSTSGNHGWMALEYLAAPGRDIAQVPAVQAADVPVTESQTSPVTETVVEQAPPAPEPTVAPAPTYAPVVAQSAQVQAEPQPGEHWIEVNRTSRTVTLHNGDIVVAQFDALIGKDPSVDGYYSTAVGTYRVHVKEKALAETPFAEGVFLTDFVGFDPARSNGFHSPVRDEFGNVVVTGGTSTLGCVRLAESDAIFLFEFAEIGMRVEVHD